MKSRKLQLATENSVSAESSLSSPAARRAKIICTIGPACHSEAAMRDLLRLGMDVARLNFSHGSHEEHARNIVLRQELEKGSMDPYVTMRSVYRQIRAAQIAGGTPPDEDPNSK